MVILGDHDEQTIEQLKRCVEAEEGARGVLCADGHLGYSAPIGGVIAYREHISPSGVGFDIACGNKAVLTNLFLSDIEGDLGRIMDEIADRISFGMGRKNNEPVDHPVLDEIRQANVPEQRRMAELAANQLGTVGAGNHYVDIFADESDRIWVGVHFGSRGFGHKTATHFLKLAGGKDGMHVPPALLPIDSEAGQAYIEAMELAGQYAYAGRDVVIDKVLEILGAEEQDFVHNHHNFAWLEEHDGESYWVVRKGATPAAPGQRGFVGSSMGEDSVILEGVESRDSAATLYSTVHGAGRAMSRTQARGKVKRRKRWECNDRNCDYFHTDRNQFACPEHPDARPLKRWHSEVTKPGLIDYAAVREELSHIEIRGGDADEAPGAYKRLDDVLAHHEGTVRVLHRLRPLGVAMAGPDIRDDYKD